MITKPEGVRFIGKFVFGRVRNQLIPNVETMLFKLPNFLLAKIRNRRAANCLFGQSFRLSCAVDETWRRYIRDPAIGQVTHEGYQSTTGQTCEVAGQYSFCSLLNATSGRIVSLLIFQAYRYRKKVGPGKCSNVIG